MLFRSDTGEDEFGFSINLDSEDIQADDESDDECDPNCHRDVVRTMPVLDDDGSSGDFSTESDCRIVPVLFREVKLVSYAFAFEFHDPVFCQA